MSEIFHKGGEVTLAIDKLAFGGKGLARKDGFVFFVEGGLPGQTVLARIDKPGKRFAEASVVKVLEETEHAVQPFCKHFGKCGGCQFQNLDYAQQLRWKTEFVRDALVRIGGQETPTVQPCVASPSTTGFRNKMEFAFAGAGERIDLGLHRRASSRIVNIEHCGLQSDTCSAIVREARDFCRSLPLPAYEPRTGKGLWRFLVVRQAGNTGEIMVQLITAPNPDGGAVRSLGAHLQELFPAITVFAHSTRKTRSAVAQGERLVYATDPGYIVDRLNGIDYRVSPHSFFQTNTGGAELLYGAATEMAGLTGEETVLDLYCGTGGLALAMAGSARHVVGVETIKEAVRDGRSNAEANGVDNCEFHAGDVAALLKDMQGGADVVVTDPPRAGMKAEAVAGIMRLTPDRIVYVSCNPTTLARDIKLMAEEYELVDVRPVDLFPHVGHVECVALLQRLK